MGKDTGISWTNHTFSTHWGCTEVGDSTQPDGIDPACRHCYARKRAENPFWWGGQEFFPIWGNDAKRRFFGDKHWDDLRKWDVAARKAGKPALVFVNSMADTFEGRPDEAEARKRLWGEIETREWLIFLLLTKRPQLAQSLVPEHWRNGWPPNAWPGTTAANQHWLDIRAPHLLRIPAAQHFLSYEPAVGPLDLRAWLRGQCPQCHGFDDYCADVAACETCRGLNPVGISWVIAGGQSGPGAQPSHPDWFRSCRDQCVTASVPWFFKQWGEWEVATGGGCIQPGELWMSENGQTCYPSAHDITGDSIYCMRRAGTKNTGSLLDGVDWKQFPSPI